MNITESDVRLVRQFLIAREEKRKKDADAIWDYLTKDRSLALVCVPRAELTDAVIAKWKVSRFVEEVVLLPKTKEPIWRIPVNLETRTVSWAEIPEEIPESLKDVVKVA